MANLFNPSELYDLLASQGVLPQWARQKTGTGARGVFFPDSNRIVAREPETREEVSTLTHEMSHSAQFQLFYEAASNIQEKLRQNKKITPEEQRFLDNAQKMYNMSFGTIGQTDRAKEKEIDDQLQRSILAMYKPQTKSGKRDDYDYYRTKPIELQAFGIGRMTKGGQNMHRSGVEVNPHLDPSFTTEFAILAEQFKKLPKDVKTTSEATKKTIQEYRKKDAEERPYYLFEDILKDPFASTIK